MFTRIIQQLVTEQSVEPLEDLLNNVRPPSPPLQSLEQLTRALQIEEFHDHCRKALQVYDANMPDATAKAYCQLFYMCVETIRITHN